MAKKKSTIKKDDFIEFLANATPDEITKYVLEKGKPRKVIDAIIFFDEEDDINNSGE